MKRNRLTGWCCGGLLLVSVVFGTGSWAAEANATGAVKLTDDQLGKLWEAAVLLARTGLYDEAADRCQRILAQKPNEVKAQQLLYEIQTVQRQHSPSSDLRRQLSEMIIPELNVREAAVSDVIELLRGQSQQLSEDKSSINFVWQAPEDAKTIKVTLDLRKVSLADVLKYATDLAGLRYRVDAHAVVIYKPLPAAPGDSTPANVKH